jgi:hypothetical protein
MLDINYEDLRKNFRLQTSERYEAAKLAQSAGEERG